MGGQNETVMKSTPTPDHTSLCVKWHRLSGGDMSGLLASGGGVSNTFCLYTDKQSDIEVIIAAVLPFGMQDKDLLTTLPEPVHGIHHKKRGKCALVQIS